MKRIKIISITLVFLFALALLLGCAARGTEDTGNYAAERSGSAMAANSPAIKIASVKAKELEKPSYGEEVPMAVAGGANGFAFRLSAALAEQNAEKNFVCSPYSVWIPLAALVNATDTQYKDGLLAALGAAGISEEDINSAASRMLYDLTRQREKEYQGYHNPLTLANAIFVSNNVTLKKEFAQTFMDYYRGVAMNVDFNSPEAVGAVNGWASENTDGLISNIVDSFDPNIVAAIANAIYFSDRWGWEFNSGETEEDVFYSPTGEAQAFFMLREGLELPYYEDDKVQAMPLSFKLGGGMHIILPKDGDATGLLSSMTKEYFNEIRDGTERATGKLLLPRFSIDSGVIRLNDTLTALGVPLFDEDAAPLTGGLIEEDLSLWLSEALYKAVIEVDEKGTTAAAVTVMQAAASAAPHEPEPTKPFEMICNKPFVFVLYSRTSDGGEQILFTGMVNRP